METLLPFLPILIPYIILAYGLAIFALVHVLKHRHYRYGNTLIWALIVMLVQIVGPVLYFAIGRGEEE